MIEEIAFQSNLDLLINKTTEVRLNEMINDKIKEQQQVGFHSLHI